MINQIKKFFYEIIIIVMLFCIILDYTNIPSNLGFNISNINRSFWTGVITVLLYVITYKEINKRIVERDKNKSEISVMLLKECYNECILYVQTLNKEVVENYIVPKVDFNSTSNPVINNLQSGPFSSENIIMDLIKDGQLTKIQIDGYFKIRKKYKQYVMMRIIFFKSKKEYEKLKTDLIDIINIEIKKLNR